ncbi:MAG: hypothetical protein VB948_05710 [Pseudomonadales bacterium]|jgi:hypothetical protein
MSDSDNPYAAPLADLGGEIERFGGSIENTLAGNAELNVADVMSEAWQRTKGIKGIVIGGGFLIYLGVAVLTVVLGFVFGFGDSQSVLGVVVTQLVTMMMIYPFFAGVFMLGLRQSVGLPVSFDQQFAHYGAALPIIGVALLQSLASMIGFLLLILPGLYLAFALALAVPLKVEKQLSISDCLTTSLKLVNKKFLNVVVLAIAASIISVLSFITLIGWIWGIPWMLMVYAITYRQLAGCDIEA